ncbi:MAG TPA: hypothetical protein VEA37_00425 [Flavobacterium sp.]|nr:hypothetical protein [Flavobacterium sp.]
MKRSKVVEQVLLEYLVDRQEYYRKKIHDKQPLKDIIQETVNVKELPILVHLVLKEFPEHKDKILKYLLIQ